MRSVLVSSTELYAGKSALCLALAMKLKENGLRVGYMKPVGNLIVDLDGVLVDDDAATMKKMLGLEESLDELSPILFTHQLLEDVLEGKDKQLAPKLEKTFRQVSKDKDVMILESAGDISGSSVLGLSDSEVARLTGSRILLVTKYCDEFTVDRITTYLKLARGREADAGHRLQQYQRRAHELRPGESGALLRPEMACRCWASSRRTGRCRPSRPGRSPKA